MIQCLFFLALASMSCISVESKGVIAVLVKASKTSQLQIRNRYLDEIFYQEGHINDFDVVIFCEKYVKPEIQQKLQNNSKLPLTFVYVDSSMRGAENKYLKKVKKRSDKMYMDATCPVNAGSNYFPFGYKAMCQFWFTDFQDYVKDYDWLLRIDDDCHLLKLKESLALTQMSSLLPLPDHVPFAPAMWTRAKYCSSSSTVTGLRDFTQQFVAAHNISSSRGQHPGQPKNISASTFPGKKSRRVKALPGVYMHACMHAFILI
jgi:hypothetical protein